MSISGLQAAAVVSTPADDFLAIINDFNTLEADLNLSLKICLRLLKDHPMICSGTEEIEQAEENCLRAGAPLSTPLLEARAKVISSSQDLLEKMTLLFNDTIQHLHASNSDYNELNEILKNPAYQKYPIVRDALRLRACIGKAVIRFCFQSLILVKGPARS